MVGPVLRWLFCQFADVSFGTRLRWVWLKDGPSHLPEIYPPNLQDVAFFATCLSHPQISLI